MITNQEIEGTFILRPLFYKWMVVSKSLLECFSIGGQAFRRTVFVWWCLFFTILKFSSL